MRLRAERDVINVDCHERRFGGRQKMANNIISALSEAAITDAGWGFR